MDRVWTRSRARRSAAALVSALVLAACGSSSDGTEAEDPTVGDPPTAVADSTDAADGGRETPEVSGDAAEDEAAKDEFELPANVWPAEVDDPDSEVDDPDPAVDDPDLANASGSKDVVRRSPDADGDGVGPVGVTTVTARVTSADGDVCEVCLWLADTSEERATGLMGVTDLGEPVGMAFVWSEPTQGRFYMLNTPTPLSIAWFATSGEHVGQADMAPCLTDEPSECERYGADAEYSLAVEMFEGQLDVIGIGPGSTAELVAGSESPTCLV